MLIAKGLGKQMAGRWLFRELSFDLDPGQVLAVRGPNGSGKSTLLRILAGLMEPDRGQVTWPGQPRQTVGYAALEMALYPHLSAREHLALGAALRSGPVEELLADSGLPGDALAGIFSSGMRARLRLLLAIQHQPSILLVDEPTVALDEPGRAWVEGILTRAKQSGVVVIATNDPRDVTLATHEVTIVA